MTEKPVMSLKGLWWAIAFTVTLAVPTAYLIDFSRDYKEMKRQLQVARETYQYRQGMTELNGKRVSYSLFSNDNGYHWYVLQELVEKDKRGNVTHSYSTPDMIILGPVEQVMPGLVDGAE